MSVPLSNSALLKITKNYFSILIQKTKMNAPSLTVDVSTRVQTLMEAISVPVTVDTS